MISDQVFIKQSKYLQILNFEILDYQTSSLKKNIDANENEWISCEDSAILKLNK